jgi:hypothetical protein
MKDVYPTLSGVSVRSGQGNSHARQWVNLPGDALCCVSPARCAVSSFTSAKRITRPILRALRSAGSGIQKLLELDVARMDVSRLPQKFRPRRPGTVIGRCDRALG